MTVLTEWTRFRVMRDKNRNNNIIAVDDQHYFFFRRLKNTNTRRESGMGGVFVKKIVK